MDKVDNDHMLANDSKRRSEKPKLKTRLSASLKPQVAAAYKALMDSTGLGDSELITQGIIRLHHDFKRDGKVFVENL